MERRQNEMNWQRVDDINKSALSTGGTKMYTNSEYLTFFPSQTVTCLNQKSLLSQTLTSVWLVLSLQVCLCCFRSTPFCSTWRTGWPSRNSRLSSSWGCLWPLESFSSRSSIWHTQVCSPYHAQVWNCLKSFPPQKGDENNPGLNMTFLFPSWWGYFITCWLALRKI